MEISTFFPVWERLSSRQQTALSSAAFSRTVARGEIIHNADTDCTGLLLVESGQLRAFILSAEGREITLYRLFERDLCLFSASCMMRSIQFDITIQAEKDAELSRLRAELERERRERENARRSAGSAVSAGGDPPYDPISAGWNSI